MLVFGIGFSRMARAGNGQKVGRQNMRQRFIGGKGHKFSGTEHFRTRGAKNKKAAA
jgi:hypothetical protein